MSDTLPDLATTEPDLVEIVIDLLGKLDRHEALEYISSSLQHLTQAEYCAVGILDSHGSIVEFVSSGLTSEERDHIPVPLARHDLFPDVPDDAPNIDNAVSEDIAQRLFPTGIIHVRNYLSLPIIVHSQPWGRVVLINKDGGFHRDDIVKLREISRAASVAVHNTRLYAQAQSRSRWLTASQEIVSSLLEGNDEEEALQVITDQMREAGRADVAMMVLPSIDDTWACEFVSGDGAAKYLGVTFPSEGRARTAIREQAGIIVNSMQHMAVVRVHVLREFGPALYAPLVSQSGGRGVIVLFRYPNSPEFDLNDLAMAENVAQQATIALELAEARSTREQAAELDERSRISRDLHDLAIQQLFASGMHITAVREEIAQSNPPESVTRALDKALGAIDESVGQIRKIVQSLRDDGSAEALVDRLQSESKMALQSLGFAPSLLITFNGRSLDACEDITHIDDAVGADISDDVVAVVREGLSNAARHAHASSVSISIAVTLDAINVCVCDDGAGLTPSPSRRSGLSNLAARARRHRGVFSLHARSDGMRGTEMTWEAPLR